MEFCLNFSVGLITPLLMLVIRNLVLLHKVKSKEAMLHCGTVQQYSSMQIPLTPPLRLSPITGRGDIFVFNKNISKHLSSFLVSAGLSSKDKRLFNQFRIWNFKIWSSLVPLKTNYHSQVSEDNIFRYVDPRCWMDSMCTDFSGNI